MAKAKTAEMAVPTVDSVMRELQTKPMAEVLAAHLEGVGGGGGGSLFSDSLKSLQKQIDDLATPVAVRASLQQAVQAIREAETNAAESQPIYGVLASAVARIANDLNVPVQAEPSDLEKREWAASIIASLPKEGMSASGIAATLQSKGWQCPSVKDFMANYAKASDYKAEGKARGSKYLPA